MLAHSPAIRMDIWFDSAGASHKPCCFHVLLRAAFLHRAGGSSAPRPPRPREPCRRGTREGGPPARYLDESALGDVQKGHFVAIKRGTKTGNLMRHVFYSYLQHYSIKVSIRITCLQATVVYIQVF